MSEESKPYIPRLLLGALGIPRGWYIAGGGEMILIHADNEVEAYEVAKGMGIQLSFVPIGHPDYTYDKESK